MKCHISQNSQGPLANSMVLCNGSLTGCLALCVEHHMHALHDDILREVAQKSRISSTPELKGNPRSRMQLRWLPSRGDCDGWQRHERGRRNHPVEGGNERGRGDERLLLGIGAVQCVAQHLGHFRRSGPKELHVARSQGLLVLSNGTTTVVFGAEKDECVPGGRPSRLRTKSTPSSPSTWGKNHENWLWNGTKCQVGSWLLNNEE